MMKIPPIKTNILLNILLISAFTICLACRSELDQLETQIRKLGRDGTISVVDWQELKATIAAHPSLSGIDDDALQKMITESSRRRTIEIAAVDSSSTNKTPDSAMATSQKSSYNIYVENSGSMYGYMDGNSEFKKSLYDLLSRFNGKEEEFNIQLINDKIHPIGNDINEFMDFFEKRNLLKMGNTAASEINKIFKMVRDQMLKDQKMAIVISDFIYSLDKRGDIIDQLALHKFSTKVVFQKVKSDYGVLVVKSVSSFNDKYYPFNSPNKGVRINEDRPFYFWVIGKKEQIMRFAEKYNIKTLDGYKQHLAIYQSNENEKPFYSILNQTKKLGNFRKERGSQVITSISGIDYDRRKSVLQFAVAVDFSGQYLDEDYLKSKKNYWVSSSSGDEFEVVEIQTIDKVEPNDDRFKGSATHFVVLQTDEVAKGEQTIELKLRKQIPKWVASSSTLDDTSPEKRNNKTFAFSYLVEGVTEAFYGTNENLTYLTLPIKLNR